MGKKADMAGYADSTFSESNSITTLKNLLESNKRIKTNFGEGDRAPNHDGYFELLRNEPEKRPKRKFNVQIKSVEKLDRTKKGKNKGKYIYDLKTEFLYYVRGMVSKDPAIYFVVDITTKNVFFIYLSEEKLKDMDFEGKTKVRYKFTDEDIINDIDSFIELLESISEEYNQNIESYGKVYNRAIQKLRTYMTEEQAEIIINKHIQNDVLTYFLPDDKRFAWISGEYGSGKSFNAEILYMQLFKEYQKNLNNCMYYPVWLKSNIENIEELVSDLENSHPEKVIVAFYDDLEQYDIDKIERKLLQFSDIAKSHKKIKLIVISRPINIKNENMKNEIMRYAYIKRIRLLSISQVANLFEIISGDNKISDIQKVEPSIQNIIRRPLFALLLINNKKIQKEIASISANQIKKYLFKNFFDRIFDKKEILKRDFIRIAIALMKSDSNCVDFDTISIDSNKNEIIRQGLVYVDDNNNVRFFIDSFKEWLSAEGIFQGVESFDNILININTLYKWKYVIIQIMERYETDSFEFVLQILKKYPAFIGILNKEWLSNVDIKAKYDSTELANFNLLFTCIMLNFHCEQNS